MAVRRASVIVFPGGFNLPLWTVIESGFLRSHGIEIDLQYTTSSVEQLSGLVAGRWDIALTGFDNVVAYQEGQGEAELTVEPDVFAFMGGDNAFLRLMVQPGVKTYADLKGRVLSVDALTTGFAFVLRKMLAVNGLAEGDVSFERAGGVLQRFEAFKTGKHAGTLVVTPFELAGSRLGFHVLQNASEVLPRYQGICAAARRGWARENASLLTDFIRAYLEALDWLFDLRNRQSACELLTRKVPNMSPELAAATCDILLADQGGFERKARLDMEGIAAVLRLRSEYGRPQKTLAEIGKYHDLSYYQTAQV